MTARVGVLVALLVTLLGGWLWGASGRWDLARELSAADVRNDLLEARVALASARVSLSDGDLGAVRRHLASARSLVGRAGGRVDPPASLPEWPGLDLAGFVAEIDEAQRLAARLDPGDGTAGGPYGPIWPAAADLTR